MQLYITTFSVYNDFEADNINEPPPYPGHPTLRSTRPKPPRAGHNQWNVTHRHACARTPTFIHRSEPYPGFEAAGSGRGDANVQLRCPTSGHSGASETDRPPLASSSIHSGMAVTIDLQARIRSRRVKSATTAGTSGSLGGSILGVRSAATGFGYGRRIWLRRDDRESRVPE